MMSAEQSVGKYFVERELTEEKQDRDFLLGISSLTSKARSCEFDLILLKLLKFSPITKSVYTS
jgi:hypothetical protein